MKIITRCAALTVLILFGCRNADYRMTSGSMEPTIKEGQVVTADEDAYLSAMPARWDVVLVEVKPDFKWVGRVVGLPGETIDIRDSMIYINDKPVPYPPNFSIRYLARTDDWNPERVSFPFKIPDTSFFYLGDNTTDAEDSRYLGPVALTQLRGKLTDPSVNARWHNSTGEGGK